MLPVYSTSSAASKVSSAARVEVLEAEVGDNRDNRRQWRRGGGGTRVGGNGGGGTVTQTCSGSLIDRGGACVIRLLTSPLRRMRPSVLLDKSAI